MPKIIVIAHNIRSTHNVGSIFRTAEGFGVERIILSGYTPYPSLALHPSAPTCAYVEGEICPADPRLPHIAEKLTAQIHKTALGAEALVPFEYRETPNIDELRMVIESWRWSKRQIRLVCQSTARRVRWRCYWAKKFTACRRSCWRKPTTSSKFRCSGKKNRLTCQWLAAWHCMVCGAATLGFCG